MKGLWLENKNLKLCHALPIPSVPEGEVLVKVIRGGICNTDIEMVKGYYPYSGILGHEFVGRVCDKNAPECLRNQVVVGEINVTCSKCQFCHSNLRTHCTDRSVLGLIKRNGCFAEFLSLPPKNLHIIPPEISIKEAVFVEPLAAAMEIQEQVCIKPSHRVLVTGDGKLGLLIAQSLKETKCDLLVYGHHPDKLKILEQRGISTTIKDSDVSPRTFDIAIECTGNASGFEFARKSLKPRGVLVLKSTYTEKVTISSEPIVVDELTILGSRCGPFPKAIEALKDKKVDVLPLLVNEFSIIDGITAFQFAQKKGVLKVQIVFEE